MKEIKQLINFKLPFRMERKMKIIVPLKTAVLSDIFFPDSMYASFSLWVIYEVP